MPQIRPKVANLWSSLSTNLTEWNLPLPKVQVSLKVSQSFKFTKSIILLDLKFNSNLTRNFNLTWNFNLTSSLLKVHLNKSSNLRKHSSLLNVKVILIRIEFLTNIYSKFRYKTQWSPADPINLQIRLIYRESRSSYTEIFHSRPSQLHKDAHHKFTKATCVPIKDTHRLSDSEVVNEK